MVTVAFVENHRILVEALELLLRNDREFKFAGAAYTIKDGYALAKRTTPDVLVLEINLPDGDSFDLVQKIKECSPRTRTLILTQVTDDSALIQAIDTGVNGFMSKDCSLPELLNTIRKIAQGNVVMPSHQLVGLLRNITREKVVVTRDAHSWERLTPREHEVLICLARGKSGAVIANELNITPLTVRTHIRNLMSKLGVHSRLEAVSFALNNKLIELSV